MKKEEALHQKAFFEWLAKAYPKIWRNTFHIPNGGERPAIVKVNPITGKKIRFSLHGKALKAMGTKAGVPDVFIAVPSPKYHGLFLEFKARKNKLTSDQQEMIYNLREEGYKAEVCYSAENAIGWLDLYLKGFE